jgi:hypothetical protein
MKNLTIDENKAKELYKTASNEFKQVLEDTFGIEFFQDKITERVRNWNDAAIATKPKYFVDTDSGICSMGESLDISKSDINLIPSEKHAKSVLAYCQLLTIVEALNEGWKADWEDSNQQKYSPTYDFYNKNIGRICCFKVKESTICLKSKELCQHLIDNFTPLLKEYFMIDENFKIMKLNIDLIKQVTYEDYKRRLDDLIPRLEELQNEETGLFKRILDFDRQDMYSLIKKVMKTSQTSQLQNRDELSFLESLEHLFNYYFYDDGGLMIKWEKYDVENTYEYIDCNKEDAFAKPYLDYNDESVPFLKEKDFHKILDWIEKDRENWREKAKEFDKNCQIKEKQYINYFI